MSKDGFFVISGLIFRFTEQISAEVTLIFEDVTDDFCQMSNVLEHFEAWRKRDFDAYKDTYFSLCLPKVSIIFALRNVVQGLKSNSFLTIFICFFLQVLGPLVRLSLITWNPLEENGTELERIEWYNTCMRYSFSEDETEDQLIDDPDVRLIPILVEKMILPKITGSARM